MILHPFILPKLVFIKFEGDRDDLKKKENHEHLYLLPHHQLHYITKISLMRKPNKIIKNIHQQTQMINPFCFYY